MILLQSRCMEEFTTVATNPTTTNTITQYTIQNIKKEAFDYLARGELNRAIEVLVSFIQI